MSPLNLSLMPLTCASCANFPNHEIQNGELIREIQKVWKPSYTVLKTKSHRSIDEATDVHDLWVLYGNYAADFAASAALKKILPEIRNFFQSVSKPLILT